MTQEHEQPRSGQVLASMTPTAQELKGLIDSGRTGDKVSFPDPGAAPLGTDDEAAGTPDTPTRVALAIRQEVRDSAGDNPTSPRLAERPRPLSPNIQIYRPQLTSVLSIANRITGVVLSVCAVGLVVWLAAAASGPYAYATIQGILSSRAGQAVLFGFSFSFFLHLCGGIRHLVWDTGHGFELRTIYISGWTVVAASVVLTVATWIVSFFLKV